MALLIRGKSSLGEKYFFAIAFLLCSHSSVGEFSQEREERVVFWQ